MPVKEKRLATDNKNENVLTSTTALVVCLKIYIFLKKEIMLSSFWWAPDFAAS